MIRHWHMLLAVFTARERLQIYVLLASTTVLALIQVAGIASIMPFIAVVVDDSIIDSNPWLNAVYARLGFTDHRQFTFFLGGLAFVMLIVSNVFTAFDAWFTFHFSYLRSHVLCTRLLRKYLSQPYRLFLQRSPAELQKIVVSEVDRVIIGTLMACIGLFSDVVATVVILGVLFFIDPVVTLTTLVVLGVGYLGIFALIQSRVARLGEESVDLSTQIMQRTREAIDGAKEIKMLGKEAQFVHRYSVPRHRLSLNSIHHKILDIIPNQSLELIAFGGIILMALYYLGQQQASGEALAVIALYAFAAYRLIPTLADIFDSIDVLRYNAAALEVVCADFGVGCGEASVAQEPDAQAESQPVAPLRMQRSVEIKDVAYSYPAAQRAAVQGLSMSIRAGELVCVMGPTGAGKSTAIDLLLGLLQPDAGEVSIDGNPLRMRDVKAWQASIGYVPQVIYLTDDSIASNIAFGEPEEDIDPARVQAAAKLADIHEFIVGELPDGYETSVGERGLRLSGGQRQRIGIARALYRDPAVLVMDEATNALDQETEQRVLAALLALQPRRSIIFVSHKISVARRADRILVLARGRLVADDTYEALTAADSQFRGLLTDA